MSDRIQNDIQKIEEALNIRLDDVEIETAINADRIRLVEAFPRPVSRTPSDRNVFESRVGGSRCSSIERRSFVELNSSLNVLYQRHLFQLSKFSQSISPSTSRVNELTPEIVQPEVFAVDKTILSSRSTTNIQSIQTVRRMIQREEKSRLTSAETVDKLIEIVVNEVRSQKQKDLQKKIELLDGIDETSENEKIRQQRELLEQLKNSSARSFIEFVDEETPIDWTNVCQLLLNKQNKASSCEFVWKEICLPKVKFGTKWSQQEDQLLKRLVQERGENDAQWSEVASHFPQRSRYLCLSRYMYLENTRLDRMKFSRENQSLLKQLVDSDRCGNYIPLNKIAYKLGSSLRSVLRHWRSIDPSIRRGIWTKQEDQILLESVSRQNGRVNVNWALVSSDVFGRSQSKCYQRYFHLTRRNDQTEFHPDDDQLLLQLHNLHLGRWAEIQKRFPGRSCYSLQNRYRKLCEHRQINELFYLQQPKVQQFLLREYPSRSPPSERPMSRERLYERPPIGLTLKQLSCLTSNSSFDEFCNGIELNQMNNRVSIRKLMKNLSTQSNEQQLRELFVK